MKKTFGLMVLLKIAKVKKRYEGGELKFNVNEAREKVERALKLYGIKLEVK